MKARLYRPAKTAMQSGKGQTKKWRLEFIPQYPPYREPLMNWIGMRDTSSQVNLSFKTEEEAKHYAQSHKIPYQALKTQSPSFKPKQYSDNFSAKRIS